MTITAEGDSQTMNLKVAGPVQNADRKVFDSNMQIMAEQLMALTSPVTKVQWTYPVLTADAKEETVTVSLDEAGADDELGKRLKNSGHRRTNCERFWRYRQRRSRIGSRYKRNSRISPIILYPDDISSRFFSALSFFIAASRLTAALLSSANSTYTGVTGSRDLVYFAPLPLLCCLSLEGISLVQPVYRLLSEHSSI